MDWDEVHVFLALARTGQAQEAGRLLGIDRTTVGRRMAALEARLGAPLFIRTRDGLSLTAAGQRALAHATRMEASARALVAETTPPDAVEGTVRISVTEGMGPFLIEQGLMAICDTHPGLRLELLVGNRRLDLKLGEADLAVRMDPLRGADLKARCLVRSAVALYASREYLARRGTPRTPKQLAGHDALLPSGELAHLPEGRWLATQSGVVPVFSSNSIPTLVIGARKGRGIVSLTSAWGNREPDLVRLFDVPKLPPRSMWLVCTAASAKRPACRVVTQRLLELFESRRVA